MIKIGNTSFSSDVFNLTKKQFFEKYKGRLNVDLSEAWKTIQSEKKKK